MKLAKILSVLIIAVVAFGCSKNDDNPIPAYEYNKRNLVGIYSVESFQSKKIKTEKVEGFDVTTTTVSTGDTFEVTATFNMDGEQIMDGTYRIVEVKTQGGQSEQRAYTIVHDNTIKTFSVSSGTSELFIGDQVFQVSNFGPTGFKLNLHETTVGDNGESIDYTEEWVFKK